MRRKIAQVILVIGAMIMLFCLCACERDTKTVSTPSYSSKTSSGSGYSGNRYSSGLNKYGNECILSHCDFSAKEGSRYCSRHGCCKDNCPNQKDPMVHCCNTHNCAEPGCGKHRYDYAKSKYCNTHYVQHYDD